MRKKLLIFAWEYNGYHSVQGTALAKRPRQVAESFYNNGWDVTVIHKDQINECNQDEKYTINIEKSGVRRIPVKQTNDIEFVNKNPLYRKLETLYYVSLRGDRSYKWANDVISNFDAFNIVNQSLIISFYTPRVPLYLGHYFSKKLKTPWLADIQDPILAGISQTYAYFCKQWMKRILRSARSIIHVSPEWAAFDSNLINRKIHTIRHSIPKEVPLIANKALLEHIEYDHNYFNIFYGGSITPSNQSLQLLKDTIMSVAPTKIKVLIAGNEGAYNYFKKELGEDIVIQLGWLKYDEMLHYISHSNCTLVIPWSKNRIGIPSKFYELCSYGKPIWIIGNDLGAFSVLLKEWQHPKIEFDSLAFQTDALKNAMNNNYDLLFNLSACHGKYLTDNDIFEAYISLT